MCSILIGAFKLEIIPDTKGINVATEYQIMDLPAGSKQNSRIDAAMDVGMMPGLRCGASH